MKCTPLPSARFDSDNARKRLLQAFNVAALESFGDFSRAEVAACGALLDYVELTQAGKRPALVPPRRERADGTMEIDPATRRNLELVKSLDGRREGSLLETIDRTLTGPGARRIVMGTPWPGDPLPLRLAGLLEEDGALFCRYRTLSAPAATIEA